MNEDKNRRFIVDGVCHPPHPKEISSRKPRTAENRIKVLDQECIQAAVLFPSATTIATYLDPGFADAMVRGHNSWIADYVKPYPNRLYFAAPVSLHDIDAAAAEARRAVDELGAVAILARPNPTEGRTLDRPEYDPFYATVQELGVPLFLHESTGCDETAGGDRYGAMSIIAGGVLAGFGTRVSGGCTSGHGVCGISLLSVRSMVATLTFMLSAGVAVYVTRHVVGG